MNNNYSHAAIEGEKIIIYIYMYNTTISIHIYITIQHFRQNLSHLSRFPRMKKNQTKISLLILWTTNDFII